MKGDTPQDNLDKREVGENIRLLRVKRGLTQQQLAEQMSEQLGKKYTANMISLYENGQDHMHMGALFDFATFFGVAPQDLAPARFLKEEEVVMSYFRKLSPENQSMFERMLKFMLTDNAAPS
ncbi:MAG: helix-turn-helix transcriptional regulator [Oscillibacter sp.]|nr:helix-turn-helix transcriptional regulator [Oscillibacter sp.]